MIGGKKGIISCRKPFIYRGFELLTSIYKKYIQVYIYYKLTNNARVREVGW